MWKQLRFGVAAAVALVLGALLYGAYSFGDSQATYHLQANDYAEADARNASPRIQLECASSTGSAYAKCKDEIIDATHERRSEEYNLEAQRKVANGTKWFLIVGCLELVLTLWGIALICDQLGATRDAIGKTEDANAIARDSAHRQLRPYVYLTRVTMSLNNTMGVVVDNAPIVLHFKNFGQTPARHVKLRAKTFIGGIWNEPFDVSFDHCALIHMGDMPPGFKKERDGYTVLAVRNAFESILFGMQTVFVCGIIEYDDGTPGKAPYRSEFRLASTDREFGDEKFSPTPLGNESD